jgi:uroporphyrinogen-III synthase
MTSGTLYLLATGELPARLIEEAAERGVLLAAVPFIDTRDVEGWDAGDAEVVVFTSARAVEAVRKRLQDAADWRIYCIGGSTREAVQSAFGDRTVVGSAGSARELAGLIGKREKGKIVFFCGDQRREELPSILAKEGFIVDERIVYRTRLTPRKTEREYAGIAFFSPSAVDSFFSLNTVGPEVPLFAIGGTTAAAIHERCSNPVMTGERPDKDALIRQMINYFLNQ